MGWKCLFLHETCLHSLRTQINELKKKNLKFISESNLSTTASQVSLVLQLEFCAPQCTNYIQKEVDLEGLESPPSSHRFPYRSI